MDNNTHPHGHIRIRRKQDKRDKTEDKYEVTARRKLYSRYKDKSTSQGAKKDKGSTKNISRKQENRDERAKVEIVPEKRLH